MKLKYLVFSLLLAGSMVFNSIGFARAGDLKVSGFADTIFTFTDDRADAPTATGDNTAESKFAVTGEVDFEKEMDSVTFRMDLDFPFSATPAMGTGADEIEQANFAWALPWGPGLTLTGGIFNSPIGFEAQDAPDLLQTSNGQLFALVPSNLAGVMLSGAAGPVGVDVIFANEWRGNATEESAFGVKVSLPLMGNMLGLDGAWLSSEDADPTTTGDEDLFDIILSGMYGGFAPDLELTYAVEYLSDENNDALALVASLRHNSPDFPHGITIRWDQVDCDVPAAPGPAAVRYCGNLGGLTTTGAAIAAPATGATPMTLTVAAFVDLAESLTAVVEFQSLDSDLSDASFTAPAKSDADLFTLEFIATF